MYNNRKLNKIKVSCSILLGLSVMLVSCKKSDWYDVKSKSSLVIPASVADFQGLIDNYQVMNVNHVSLGEIASDDAYITDLSFGQLLPKERNAYTWSHNEPYLLLNDWGNGQDGVYLRVYYANLALDGLKKLNSSSDVQYNNVKGQALFTRSANLFELAQVFAPPYDPATAANELGIPVRLESDVNIPSKRGSLKDMYDQIINDLKEASNLMPEYALVPTRPSKGAAYALLARIYLSMENYDQAGFYANECLKIAPALLDFNSITTTSPAIPPYNQEVMFQSLMVNSGGLSYLSLIDRDLYDSYEANDLRKTKFFLLNANNTVSFNGSYFYAAPFNGLATDEVYLIRAEANARAGKADAAMGDLNTLLRKRYVTNTYVDKTAGSADDALRKVLAERRKELIRRGQRWLDLRRLNRDERFRKTFTRVVAGNTYTLEPGSYKYTFPIPDDVIEKSGIQQNKGW